MTLPPKLIILLLAALALTTIHLLTRIHRTLRHRHLSRQYGCRPIARSFNRDPFLGLDTLPSMIRAIRAHRILARGPELFARYGRTFTTRELQHRIILTIEPENIKTILSVNFQDYGLGHRTEPFRPLLGQGIFNSDGAHWAASRALLRPSFARDQVVADLAALEELIQDLWTVLPRDGATVDLQEWFFKYTIDSATGFLFGESVHTLRTPMGPTQKGVGVGFAEAFQYAQKAVLVRGTLGWLNAFYRDRKAEECNRRCRDFVRVFVDEAVRAVEMRKTGDDQVDVDAVEGGKPKGKRIFSHELAARTADKERILDELMAVLLAGRDTTASLLGNLFFMLAKNPAIWARLRRDVECLQGRPPSYEELQGLRFVECCIKESLRLHPVVPRNQREAIRDTVLPLGGGDDGLSPAFVPKGTLVGYNLYAMHRRADLYGDDADDFRPERWEDGKLQLRLRWGYLPFNGGPRICIGQRYALTEASYVLVRMVQEFRGLESRDPGPWEESRGLTLCSRNGTRVGLIR
ncbi:cytochrome P450 [Aspergillus aculeatinus CBS 121060]|uniref:Cytochrome P450 alkane hydroxylase n=1 Tax=Aspergillus aculeatinus CBS 121060 TaxID=1448322 RepID=A0ACD1H072_9EURO|nr:putative cytochrome P450 alkane hydroxylase [Aspergillus aculeatinus CBS 121060]RAH67142.1 putative cytochrome P450 alkane hydroxylase [Aspergillus aculeatinus CBS 121060]